MSDIGSLVQYEVGSRYPKPEEEPETDSVGLFIESIPVYKIWFAAPVQVEQACLEGTCTHIGLVPHSRIPGGLPLFRFVNPADGSLLVRAPLTGTSQQIERWSLADSNGFMFLLIERGSQIIRQIRIVGVPLDFRREVEQAWLSITHPSYGANGAEEYSDQQVVRSAVLWAYNPDTVSFERNV